MIFWNITCGSVTRIMGAPLTLTSPRSELPSCSTWTLTGVPAAIRRARDAWSSRIRRPAEQSTVTGVVRMRRPVNVEPSGLQPTLAACASEIRLSPVPRDRPGRLQAVEQAAQGPGVGVECGPALAGE